MSATILDAQIGAILSRMIELAFGSCAAKKAAPYAVASPRTLEKAIQGRTELGGWKLLRMARHPGFREVLRAYLDQIDRREADEILRMAVDDEKCCGVIADLDWARSERARGLAGQSWTGSAAACEIAHQVKA